MRGPASLWQNAIGVPSAAISPQSDVRIPIPWAKCPWLMLCCHHPIFFFFFSSTPQSDVAAHTDTKGFSRAITPSLALSSQKGSDMTDRAHVLSGEIVMLK